MNEILFMGTTIEEQMLDDGKQYIQDNHLQNITYHWDLNGIQLQGEIYQYYPQITIEQLKITEFTCTCNQIGPDHICSHCASLAYYYMINEAKLNYSLKNQSELHHNYITHQITKLSKRLEDQTLNEIVDHFESQLLSHIGEYKLILKLETNIDKVECIFELGFNQNYNSIEYMTHFMQLFNKAVYVGYGTIAPFHHHIVLFDTASRMILNHFKEMNHDTLQLFNQRRLTNAMQSILFKEIQINELKLDKIYPIKYQTPILFTVIKEDYFKLIVKPYQQIIKMDDCALILMNDELYYLDAKIASLVTNMLALTTNNEILLTNEILAQFNQSIRQQLESFQLIEQSNLLPVLEKPQFNIDIDLTRKPLLKIILHIDVNYSHSKYSVFSTEDREKRNIVYEKALIKTLTNIDFIKNENQLELTGLPNIISFYEDYLSKLDQIAVLTTSKEFIDLYQGLDDVPFELEVNFVEDQLEVKMKSLKYQPSQLKEIFKAINTQPYLYLKNGGIINLNNKRFKDIQRLYDDLGIADHDFTKAIYLPKYYALMLDAQSQHLMKTRNQVFDTLITQIQNLNKSQIDLPDDMDVTFRPYQIEGYQWLSGIRALSFGGILADDMGLGKTLQMITLLTKIYQEGCQLPSLIVVPTSLIYNWKHEFSRFSPKLRVSIIQGTKIERQTILNHSGETEVFITTYGQLRNDIASYQKIQFECVVLDEAQAIKNVQTINAKSVKKLNKRVGFALTGTPMENNLSELYSIFDFVLPGFFRTHKYFKERFEKPIMKENQAVMNELTQLVSPFILRRTKKDVLKDLPDKIESMHYVVMTEPQRQLYDAYLSDAIFEFRSLSSKDFDKNRLQILALLMRLRQICNHPKLVIEDYTGGSGKLDATIEFIEQAISEGHRILLFSQFTSMLKIIKEEFDKKNIGYFYLDGKVSARERIELVNTFNSGVQDVFLISLKAGSTGLNLTSADVVVHFDPWWNPSVMVQATDRAHRIGQKKVVSVINMVSEDSIEERIIELQEKKKDLIERVIKEGGQPIMGLSKEEIESLFKH